MVVLDLDKYRTIGHHVFSGRPRGESVRENAGLDEIDRSDDVVQVQIPGDIWSVNASFFLGLFGRSIKHFQNKQAFLKKYNFECTPQIMEDVESGIRSALKAPVH